MKLIKLFSNIIFFTALSCAKISPHSQGTRDTHTSPSLASSAGNVTIPAMNGERPMKVLAISRAKNLAAAEFPYSDGRGVQFNIDFDTCLPKDKQIYTKRAPMVIENRENVTLSGVYIESDAETPALIIRNSSHVTISSSFFTRGIGIVIEQSDHISIVDNVFAKYKHRGLFVSDDSHHVTISQNRFVNPQRRGESEDNPLDETISIQFSHSLSEGSAIQGNRFLMQEGKSYTSHVISLLNSSGTEEQPVEITGNQILGGIGHPKAQGISIQGSGTKHVFIAQNTLLNSGHVGIGLAGGSHISVIANTIYAVGHPYSAAGIYSWNKDKRSPCRQHSIKFNRVKVETSDYRASGFFNSGECGAATSQNNFNDNSLVGGDFFQQDVMCQENSRHYHALGVNEASLALEN